MGFLPPLRRVLAALPQTRQTLLFSATLSTEVVRLVGRVHTRPAARGRLERADGGAHGDPSRPSGCRRSQARAAPARPDADASGPGTRLLQDEARLGSGRRLSRAAPASRWRSFTATRARVRASEPLADFKAGRVAVLVATDIAARGLDIAQLPLVVNYDLPLVAEDYVHRVGRTGRAGLAGRASVARVGVRTAAAARHPAAAAVAARTRRRRTTRSQVGSRAPSRRRTQPLSPTARRIAEVPALEPASGSSATPEPRAHGVVVRSATSGPAGLSWRCRLACSARPTRSGRTRGSGQAIGPCSICAAPRCRQTPATSSNRRTRLRA